MTKEKETKSVAIIGGGAVGLAIARELSQAGYEVFLFERDAHFGSAQSTRNSGVWHGGMYYPPYSLKARLCVEGRRLAYQFCNQCKLPCIKTGKVIVAQNAEEERRIDFYFVRGWANGVEGLRKISREELKEFEPNIEGYSALYSPETGIVDAGVFVQKLASLAGEAGATLLSGRMVYEIQRCDSKFLLKIKNSDGTRDEFFSDWIINAAGVYADEIATMVNPENKHRWHVIPVRGEYYCYSSAKKPELAISHCVYGLPTETPISAGGIVFGLGIHLVPTVDASYAGVARLSDTVLVGPSSKVIGSKDDYAGDRYPPEHFLSAVRPMMPRLALGDLKEGYAGIRSELRESNDFLIQRDSRHSRCIHLLGIRSPGLTASLAIAPYVKENFLQVAI